MHVTSELAEKLSAFSDHGALYVPNVLVVDSIKMENLMYGVIE